jgi:hypothetical protein
VVERPDTRPYLLYHITEDASKNRPGGLKGRNTAPKVVKHHANLEVPQRCFVRLFKKYWSLCPPDAPESAFYLQPAQTPSPSCWYSKRPLGHNTLAKTDPRMCSSAGIQGYKTKPFTSCDINQQVVPLRDRWTACNGKNRPPEHQWSSILQENL